MCVIVPEVILKKKENSKISGKKMAETQIGWRAKIVKKKETNVALSFHIHITWKRLSPVKSFRFPHLSHTTCYYANLFVSIAEPNTTHRTTERSLQAEKNNRNENGKNLKWILFAHGFSLHLMQPNFFLFLFCWYTF